MGPRLTGMSAGAEEDEGATTEGPKTLLRDLGVPEEEPCGLTIDEARERGCR
jgi:hypothetical protein